MKVPSILLLKYETSALFYWNQIDNRWHLSCHHLKSTTTNAANTSYPERKYHSATCYTFCFNFQTFVALIFVLLSDIMDKTFSCWPPITKTSTDVYPGKWYDGGFHLTCIDNIGLSMCIGLCQKATGCSVVNFDRNQTQCSLVKETRDITLDDMITSVSTDFVAVMNETTVSKVYTPLLEWDLKIKKWWPDTTRLSEFRKWVSVAYR